MRYNYLYMDPWSADKKESYLGRKPLYICLSGNSGVGKSTLLKRLSASLFKNDSHTIAVDEKSVHHSLLPYLFDDTNNYGYLIQLNFMLKAEYISRDQHHAYMKLWESINDLVNKPDIIAFINYSAEHSIAHINNDEMYGIRPEEFPDEEAKARWIKGWHAEYQHFVENLPAHLHQRVMICNHPGKIDKFSDMLIEKAMMLRR